MYFDYCYFICSFSQGWGCGAATTNWNEKYCIKRTIAWIIAAASLSHENIFLQNFIQQIKNKNYKNRKLRCARDFQCQRLLEDCIKVTAKLQHICSYSILKLLLFFATYILNIQWYNLVRNYNKGKKTFTRFFFYKRAIIKNVSAQTAKET
jgi:hypothetical protein